MDVTPAQYLLIVIRERLSGFLQGEGYSEESVLYAAKLATAFWTGYTLDVVLTDLRFILEPSGYAGILGWFKLHYPLTFSSFPPELRQIDAEEGGKLQRKRYFGSDPKAIIPESHQTTWRPRPCQVQRQSNSWEADSRHYRNWAVAHWPGEPCEVCCLELRWFEFTVVCRGAVLGQDIFCRHYHVAGNALEW